MATPTINSLTSYELNDEEQLQGSILTIAQKQFYQNHLAGIAEEKLALSFDTANPTEFIQQEGYKRGQLEILQWILTCSEESELILEQRNNPTDPSTLTDQ